MRLWGSLALMFLVAAVAAQGDIPERSVEQVRWAVAAFLGVTPDTTAQALVVEFRGAADKPASYDVNMVDPTTGPQGDLPVLLSVDPTRFYVRNACWQLKAPSKDQQDQPDLDLLDTRALAEAFASQHFKPWTYRMVLEEQNATTIGGRLLHFFSWSEWSGGVRTGTCVCVCVVPRPPAGAVQGYATYVAPPYSPEVVRVTKERARQLALAEAQAKGLATPAVQEATLYLSQEFLEQPHWQIIVKDTATYNAGSRIFVDAVTGKILQQKW